jgi:hypothetical protein
MKNTLSNLLHIGKFRGHDLATDFRPSDYAKSRFAHKIFPTYFKKIKAIPNPKKREVDFHLYLDDKLIGYAELEVKFVWKTHEWTQYPNIQFPAKKHILLKRAFRLSWLCSMRQVLTPSS